MKKAKYPDWAPTELVESLKTRRKYNHIMTSTAQNKAVDYMLEHSTNIEACSEEQKQELRARYHDSFVLFPLEEQIEILERLLTNENMEKGWKSLSKRIKNANEYDKFWNTCMEAITEGRRSYQRSGAQHKEHFEKIEKYASTLSKLLEETAEMIYFPITKLISDGKIDRFRTQLHIPPEKNVQHVRSYLNGVIPDIQAILHKVAVKAEEISKVEPLVKKVNSNNAEIHYLVRSLSKYFSTQYGQPLHGVVAATAGVIFDKPEIDADYVHKLFQ